jgi:hypothetical protein
MGCFSGQVVCWWLGCFEGFCGDVCGGEEGVLVRVQVRLQDACRGCLVMVLESAWFSVKVFCEGFLDVCWGHVLGLKMFAVEARLGLLWEGIGSGSGGCVKSLLGSGFDAVGSGLESKFL